MKINLRLFALIFCLLPIVAESYDLPELGTPERQHMSRLEEKVAGYLFLDLINTQTERLNDPLLVQYLTDLGTQITNVSNHNQRSFQFFIIANPVINAFAGPNGRIGFHTGLLLAADTEEEIAAVLAHEIAHVTQNHLARNIQNLNEQSWQSMTAAAASILAGIYTQNAEVGIAGVLAAGARQQEQALRHSRDFEREADRTGIRYLSNAGYVTAAWPAFLRRLLKSDYQPYSYEFLRTHPLTPDRISDAQNFSSQKPTGQYRESLTFKLVQARVAFLTRKHMPHYDNSLSAQYYRALDWFVHKDERLDTWLQNNRHKHMFFEVLAIEQDIRNSTPDVGKSIEKLQAMYPNHLATQAVAAQTCHGDSPVLEYLMNRIKHSADKAFTMRLIADCYAKSTARIDSLYFAAWSKKISGRFNESQYLFNEVEQETPRKSLRENARHHREEIERWQRLL